jgi:hypothetical protein
MPPGCYHSFVMADFWRLRTVTTLGWIAVSLTALVVSGVFYFRWSEPRRIEERLRQERIEKQRAEDQRVVEMLGGSRFEILSFYASPGVIRRGESLQLCYGVSNAKTVRLEPQSNAVWPSASKCVYVSPVKDTTYTLTIEDGAGHTKSANLSVLVR